MAAILFFWAGALLIFYTFAGYPLLLRLLALGRNARFPKATASKANISVVIIARNEAHRIGRRIENLLGCRLLNGTRELLVVSDGSTDSTPELAASHGGVRVLKQPTALGKSACLNIALAEAKGEIVVFADARQSFEPDTIERLLSHFADPTVGAVSGALEIAPSSTNTGKGVDLYWRMEKMVRSCESLLHSCIGCTGAVYAIRRSAFRPIPHDTILDDLLIPMQIAQQGLRVLFDEHAIAHDYQALEPAQEKVRKTRTIAGNFQLLFRYPAWLLPWRNHLWWQLLSHKYLRLFAPVALVICLGSNLFLDSPFFQCTLAAQCFFYGLAAFGMLSPSTNKSLFTAPAGFVFLNCMTVLGFLRYLAPKHQRGWNSTKTANPAS